MSDAPQFVCPYCAKPTDFPLLHVSEFHPLWAARFEHAYTVDQRNATGGPYTEASTRVKRLVKLYGPRCLACQRKDRRLTVDHVVPLVEGGPDRMSNWQPLCAPCNQRKGRATVDYRQAISA